MNNATLNTRPPSQPGKRPSRALSVVIKALLAPYFVAAFMPIHFAAIMSPHSGVSHNMAKSSSEVVYSAANALQRIRAAGCTKRIGQAPFTVEVGVVRSGSATMVLTGVCIDHRGPFPFAVDSGSSISVVDSGLTGLGTAISLGSAERVKAVGCDVTARSAHLSNWSVGGVTMANQNVVSVKIGGQSKVGIDGAIGSDVLSRFDQVRIDYQHQTMTFAQSEQPVPRAAVEIIKPSQIGTPSFLLRSMDNTAISIQVIETSQGTIVSTIVKVLGVPLNFVVDTGAAISAISKIIGVSLQSTPTHFSMYSAGCVISGHESLSGHWTVGTQALKPQGILNVTLPGLVMTGLLGSDVFFDYHQLVIDYQNGRMYLGAT